MRLNSERWSAVVEEFRFGQDGLEGESNSKQFFLYSAMFYDGKGSARSLSLRWDGKYLLCKTILSCLSCKHLSLKFSRMAPVPCSLQPQKQRELLRTRPTVSGFKAFTNASRARPTKTCFGCQGGARRPVPRGCDGKELTKARAEPWVSRGYRSNV